MKIANAIDLLIDRMIEQRSPQRRELTFQLVDSDLRGHGTVLHTLVAVINLYVRGRLWKAPLVSGRKRNMLTDDQRNSLSVKGQIVEKEAGNKDHDYGRLGHHFPLAPLGRSAATDTST